MKCIIIYVSKHKGNTKKVAQKLGETLNCEVKSVDEITPQELEKYQVIGIGSGIYAFKMDSKIKKLLKNTSGKKAFLFSTSANLNGLKYHKEMKKFLTKKRFQIIGEFNCPGEYEGWFFGKKHLHIGKPSQEELERAQMFAKSIIEKF